MSDEKLLLVDTSVWIEALRPGGHRGCRELVRKALGGGAKDGAAEGWRLVTCDLVIAELLCGATTRGKDVSQLRFALGVIPVLPWPEGLGLLAAEWAEALRKKGAGAKPTDFLLSALAVTHDAVLAHRDKHFELIAQVAPLETLPVGLN